MIIGQTIHGDGASLVVYWTPWMPRVEDNAVFTYQRIYSTLSSAEDVKVYHKKAEDAGVGTDAGASFSQIGSTGIFEAEADDLMEMVRFRIKLERTSGWLHYRFLQPTWYATAKV